jgi:hypothetical protein
MRVSRHHLLRSLTVYQGQWYQAMGGDRAEIESALGVLDVDNNRVYDRDWAPLVAREPDLWSDFAAGPAAFRAYGMQMSNGAAIFILGPDCRPLVVRTTPEFPVSEHAACTAFHVLCRMAVFRQPAQVVLHYSLRAMASRIQRLIHGEALPAPLILPDAAPACDALQEWATDTRWPSPTATSCGHRLLECRWSRWAAGASSATARC